MRQFNTKRLVEIDGDTYTLADANVAWMEALDEIDKLRPQEKKADDKPSTKELSPEESLDDARKLSQWSDAMIAHCVPEFDAAKLVPLGLPIKMELAAGLNALVREISLDRAGIGVTDVPPSSPDGKG